MKYILIGWLLTAFIAMFYWNIANNRKDEIKILKNNYEECNGKISKYNSAQEKASQTIEKVRTVVRTIKSDCNCYDVVVDERVRNAIKSNRRKNNK